MLKETEATRCEKCGEYGPRPSIAVDGIVLVDRKLVLIKRLNEPFKDKWALPGGYVNIGETVEEAVVREVKEETGLDTVVHSMLGVYSEPGRDPRNTISVAFILKHLGGELKEGDDAKDAATFNMFKLPELAFDHAIVVDDFRKTDPKEWIIHCPSCSDLNKCFPNMPDQCPKVNR